jgi:DeoR/GlpR family transcriptional regulator of sugar metabolism
MDTNTRKEKILALLQTQKSMEVDRIASYFDVTSATIRRDLTSLENEHLITRSRGYAQIANSIYYSDYTIRKNINKEEKERIVAAAAELIEPGSSIIIDSGTTMLALAEYLNVNTIDGLSVVTHAVHTAMLLAPKYQTMIPNGIIDAPTMSVIGPTVEQFFSNIKVDTCFLCSTGVIDSYGLTAASIHHTAIKKQMIKSAAEVIAVIDSSKFSSSGINMVCEFSEIDKLITVETVDNARTLENIRAKGVEVILA